MEKSTDTTNTATAQALTTPSGSRRKIASKIKNFCVGRGSRLKEGENLKIIRRFTYERSGLDLKVLPPLDDANVEDRHEVRNERS